MESEKLYIQRELIELAQCIGQMATDLPSLEDPEEYNVKISMCLRRFGDLVLKFKRWEPETIGKFLKEKGK